VAVVVITHDRDFADEVAEELLVLRNLELHVFRGNLSLYERERHRMAKHMASMKDVQEKQKEQLKQQIQHNIQHAKRTGDDKKLKQSASRQKKLDERMGLEVSAKGGRFKLNRDLAGYHNSNRAEIVVPDFDPPVKLTIPSTPPDLRFPGCIVNLQDVSFAYPGRNKATPILQDINLTIHPCDRVGLAGLNGAGKSTLISLILANSEESAGAFQPSKGTIERHSRARIGRFSQQAVEDLDALPEAGQVSALRHLMDTAGPDMTEKDARGLLGGLGLQGQIASDVPLRALSGGQKVRLALAKLLWPPPHLLILDEVTTHLDADTILALSIALKRYEGALLAVTHDRFFMRTVVEGGKPYSRRVTDDENADDDSSEDEDSQSSSPSKGVVYRLTKGQLKKLDRGMDQYEEIAARSAARLMK
jgi:ATP-binding cassette, subfamily F, member 3